MYIDALDLWASRPRERTLPSTTHASSPVHVYTPCTHTNCGQMWVLPVPCSHSPSPEQNAQRGLDVPSGTLERGLRLRFRKAHRCHLSE